MRPDWNFGNDDAKRRIFIEWVWRELDRFAAMTGNEPAPYDGTIDLEELLSGAKGRVGRPAIASSGMNGLIWEYALLRYMFDRYWPGKRRRVADPAHAANIALARCTAGLPKGQKTSARLSAKSELRDRLLEEWDRRTQSSGWLLAQSDIAILDGLPDNRFSG